MIETDIVVIGGGTTGSAAAVKQYLNDIRDVPIQQLREELTKDGMELDPQKHRPFAPHESRWDDDDK